MTLGNIEISLDQNFAFASLGIFLLLGTLRPGIAVVPAVSQPTTLPATRGMPDAADVPPAAPGDLRVGIATAEPGSAKPDALGAISAVLAYVLNISDHPVRVYVPGLVGPNLGAYKGTGQEVLTPDNRVGAAFGPADFVVLRPGDLIGRRQARADSGANRESVAYYTFYRPGEEGRQDAIVGTADSEGRYLARHRR